MKIDLLMEWIRYRQLTVAMLRRDLVNWIWTPFRSGFGWSYRGLRATRTVTVERRCDLHGDSGWWAIEAGKATQDYDGFVFNEQLSDSQWYLQQALSNDIALLKAIALNPDRECDDCTLHRAKLSDAGKSVADSMLYPRGRIRRPEDAIADIILENASRT